MVPLNVDGQSIDGGPTVLTMLWVFEALFQAAGVDVHDVLELTPAERLARHFWVDGSRLDLYADLHRSYEAIKAFSGAQEADAFIRYHDYTNAFMRVSKMCSFPKPTVWGS